jgi:histidinol dehydrogenase
MKVFETRKTHFDKLEKILLGKHVEPELARIETSVRTIVDAVRREGDRAVARFTEKFDGVSLRPNQFRVGQEEIRAAARKLAPESLRALRRAHKNIIAFHKKHLRRSWLEKTSDGSALGQKLTPIERVGVYCPGGTAFYPSSVLMNIAPARVAGCKEIIMVSPPSSGGTIHPGLLVAADIAGATKVYRIGGAQAVAALAYGTKTVPGVDKITGPGNIYVATAKRIVTGRVAIDMEAGPSEILIIADSSADPRLVAADILSQAEHDEMARSILVTTSRKLADRVLVEVNRQLQASDRKKIIRASLKRSGIVIIARSMKEAIEIANLQAPEHLELIVKNPERLLEKITNAGVVFLGAQTPNSVGDYMAGANHILPTGGRARFASPLTAEDFRKVTNVVKYSSRRLKNEADDIIEIAELEGLTAHAEAVRVRLRK